MVQLGFAQTNQFVDYSIVVTDGMPKAETGTFQFILSDSKRVPAFTTDILYFIEDVALPIAKDVVLYIPSKEKIASEDFEPLTEMSF